LLLPLLLLMQACALLVPDCYCMLLLLWKHLILLVLLLFGLTADD
jgi:hypothetical protein